jgi:chromosome partitioning protein
VPSTASPNLLCVPATIDLAGAEIELVSLVAREGRLKQALSPEALDELASTTSSSTARRRWGCSR